MKIQSFLWIFGSFGVILYIILWLKLYNLPISNHSISSYLIKDPIIVNKKVSKTVLKHSTLSNSQKNPFIFDSRVSKWIAKSPPSTATYQLKDLTTLEEVSEKVTIAVVICGSREDEALVMIKSAIVFQNLVKLEFIIFSEYKLQEKLEKKLDRWKFLAKNSFSFKLYNISFPKSRENEWKYLFQPCASQRLFFPNILSNMSHILYVDTDVLFLNELIDIWSHFKFMNSSQMVALVPEHEDPNIGWYNRFARHPYYGKLGVNSGVMLMNLVKMREFMWVDKMEPIFVKYKCNISWGDQDIINIVFSYHPEKLYVYSCRYNYRPDHCMYKSGCKEAEKKGVSVIHGNRGSFHSKKQSTFNAIYNAFYNYKLGSDIVTYLINPLIMDLKKTKSTNCGSMMNIFIKNLIRLYQVPWTI